MIDLKWWTSIKLRTRGWSREASSSDSILAGNVEYGNCVTRAAESFNFGFRGYILRVRAHLGNHTGCAVRISHGAVYSKNTRQKLNTNSSMEAELVALSDSTIQIVRTRFFLEEQVYKMEPATVYEDDMSIIAMFKNGRSNSERTRHISIRFFFVADI